MASIVVEDVVIFAHAKLSPCVYSQRVLVLHPLICLSAGEPCSSIISAHCAAHLHKRQEKYPFEIAAIVVLPDDLHAVLSLPPEDADFSMRWRLIKMRFAKSLPQGERRSAVRRARGERGVWQRRFWEHLIRDDGDYVRHVEYCYINPVKHGLVRRVQDWPHSSFHRDVRRGLFPVGLGGWDRVKQVSSASARK